MKTKHKKIYISLVLLFGFFVFVTQNVLADLIDPMKKISDEECIIDKKKKLSKKYKGPNLAIELNSINYPTSSYIRLGNRYFIDLKTFDKEKCNNGKPWENNFEQDLKKYERGFYVNCREYIKFNKKQDESLGEITTFFVDVTEVPPDSYLKYQPKKKTFKVISPTDKNYDSVIKKHKEDIDSCRFIRRSRVYREHNKRNKEADICLKEINVKKSQFSQDHLNKYIELKYCKKCAKTGYLNSMFSSLFKKARGFNSGSKYIVYMDVSDSHNKQDVEWRMIESIILYSNCHEYIGIKNDSDFYVADITNVPPNSYLQYIPESKILKIISPDDDNYKNMQQKYKEKYSKGKYIELSANSVVF